MSAPANPETLRTLAGLWAEVLGVKSVKPDDNFFALGGHSLMAVKLISAIQERMGVGEELKLADILEYPTLAAFADHLTGLGESEETGEI
ncbi:MAG TPA: phosphopantetheine-binding protein [Rhizomicrobium sp.]|jgi:acyl carrier protein|nr:phosphopantetheine-binding protein [Rhizomicrobium sp.]